MEHQAIVVASAAGPSGGTTKKHTRSRGRSKKAQDPYASAYGFVPFEMAFDVRPGLFARIPDLGEATVGKHVLLSGKVWSVRPLGRTRAVVVLFSCFPSSSTVRCVVAAGSHEGTVTTRMVRFAATMSRETYIDVEGVVSLPESGKILGTTQQVEILVRKLHGIELGRGTKPQVGKAQRSRTSITPIPVKLDDSVVEPEGEVGRTGQVGSNVFCSHVLSNVNHFE